MATARYQVEFKSDDRVDWMVDDEFESLGEAMAFATERSLFFGELKHRVTKTVVVMNFPAMGEHQ